MVNKNQKDIMSVFKQALQNAGINAELINLTGEDEDSSSDSDTVNSKDNPF